MKQKHEVGKSLNTLPTQICERLENLNINNMGEAREEGLQGTANGTEEAGEEVQSMPKSKTSQRQEPSKNEEAGEEVYQSMPKSKTLQRQEPSKNETEIKKDEQMNYNVKDSKTLPLESPSPASINGTEQAGEEVQVHQSMPKLKTSPSSQDSSLKAPPSPSSSISRYQQRTSLNNSSETNPVNELAKIKGADHRNHENLDQEQTSKDSSCQSSTRITRKKSLCNQIESRDSSLSKLQKSEQYTEEAELNKNEPIDYNNKSYKTLPTAPSDQPGSRGLEDDFAKSCTDCSSTSQTNAGVKSDQLGDKEGDEIPRGRSTSKRQTSSMRADSTKYIDRSEKKRTQKLRTAKPQTSMLNFITRIPKPENNPEIEIKTYINRPRSHSDIYKHLEKN